MSSESIPVGLRSLLTKHYFLAQITTGKKPCMTNMKLIDKSSWLCKPYRFLVVGETRKTVMTDIENIISQTIDAISTHQTKPAFLKLIINALASTRVGLESMTTTYRSDPDMISRLRVQLINIDLQLEKYRNLIKGYNGSDEQTITPIQDPDSDDNEGLKKFLRSKIPVPVPVPSHPVPHPVPHTDDMSRSDRDRMRRRRQRVKHSTDGSELSETN